MLYKLPLDVKVLEDNTYSAKCPLVRAVAHGETAEEAISNLKDAIREMVKEFGPDAVFGKTMEIAI